MTREELAVEVLATLAAQKKYFKSRSQEDLIASKKLESTLKKRCEILISRADDGDDFLKQEQA